VGIEHEGMLSAGADEPRPGAEEPRLPLGGALTIPARISDDEDGPELAALADEWADAYARSRGLRVYGVEWSMGRLRPDQPSGPTSACRRCQRPAPDLDEPAALYWELIPGDEHSEGRWRDPPGLFDPARAACDSGREGARPPTV
jgi:hypothetical protein